MNRKLLSLVYWGTVFIVIGEVWFYAWIFNPNIDSGTVWFVAFIVGGLYGGLSKILFYTQELLKRKS